jgi:hypothetical protein
MLRPVVSGASTGGCCRPRAAGGRPLAGLEFVEKLLTDSIVALLDVAGGWHVTLR